MKNIIEHYSDPEKFTRVPAGETQTFKENEGVMIVKEGDDTPEIKWFSKEHTLEGPFAYAVLPDEKKAEAREWVRKRLLANSAKYRSRCTLGLVAGLAGMGYMAPMLVPGDTSLTVFGLFIVMLFAVMFFAGEIIRTHYLKLRNVSFTYIGQPLEIVEGPGK